MNLTTGCQHGADNQFGPRVTTECRSFDFTLLFEDGFFTILPAVLFLLLVPGRLRKLYRTNVKVSSYSLAIWKLGFLGILFVLHVLFLAFRAQMSTLYTKLSLPSGILTAAAILAAAVYSFLEDQRSIKPSDLLVIYYSTSTILFIPRLRSLWLTPSVYAPKALWTIVFIGTVSMVFLESVHKTKFLQRHFQISSAEQRFGFWGKSFFIWCLPLFRSGYSTSLQLEDIPKVDPDLEEKSTWNDLESSWQRVHGRHRLFRATLLANWISITSAIPPRLALSALTICQPFLVEVSVSYMNDRASSESTDDTYGAAILGAFILVYLGLALSRAIYYRQIYRMIARIRASLTAKLYRHTAGLRASEVKGSAAVTLMGTDTERIVDAMVKTHEIWASVLEVGIALWLLVRQISFAALVPLAICVVSVLGASRVAALFGPAQKAWNERVQARISVTISMISDMKAVKMLGLTTVLSSMITKKRVEELQASEKFRGLLTWRILVSNAPSTVAPFLTFCVYAAIAVSKNDQTLLSAQAFTSLSLISILTFPLLILCQALPSFFQAISCFGRIEAYFLEAPVSAEELPTSTLAPENSDETEMRDLNRQQSIISFHNARISWSADASDVILHDLDLTIGRGLTAIIGPVASGKSTLLSTMIGETNLLFGSMTPKSLSGVGYCSQTPWIVNDSIKQNIVGGSEFDQKWFDFSIWSCGLQDDLSRLPKGEQTLAGSNGSSLSGGQRQRVALARAVYSRLPTVILDDVFSGLDNKTASQVIARLFSREGHFRKAGISVVIATHILRVLPYMDKVVVLENGALVAQGSLEEMKTQLGPSFEQKEELVDLASAASDEGVDAYEPSVKITDSPQEDLAIRVNPPSQKTRPERRYSSLPVYRYYSSTAKTWTLALWVFSTASEAVAGAMSTIWVNFWTAANEEKPNQRLGLYLGIYALLVVLCNSAVAVECWVFFVKIISDTAYKMHSDLLHTTTSAPFSFFQRIDRGSITNRFSQDMDLVDMRLPSTLTQFSTGAASCVVQLIVLCVLGRYLAAVIPVLAAVLFVVQRYYLRTSQQVRLIDIEAKAPLYSHFVETAEGVATIRAFRWQDAFVLRHSEILDQAQRPFYMLYCIQQWLELVLDLVVGALAVVVVAVATSASNSFNAGTLGVALVLILQFNSLLGQAVKAWTGLETSIGAVARIRQYMQDTPCEAKGSISAPAVWPSHGAVSFENVLARYSLEAPPALEDVSLDVKPGEKIALVGQSGSGKSSLIMSTLKMVDLSGGCILVDGLDLSQMSGDEIRSRLNVVPQEPFFMPGSIRFNLNPHGNLTDSATKSALEAIGLWEKIRGNGGEGLDKELVTSEWSQGERQLLCLARALLIPSKVVILDEAMSSVDERSEAIMQDVIDRHFRDRTVISVLHRFRFITRFDKVAMLRSGKLIEFDTPQALLSRNSAFNELYQAKFTNCQLP